MKTKRIITAAVMIHHVTTCSLDEFMRLESMGVQCSPHYSNCRCGKCPIEAKDCKLKEEQELALIEHNLTFRGSHWVEEYPWIKDPADLPDNWHVAIMTLKALEQRLGHDSTKAAVYNAQIKDSIQ